MPLQVVNGAATACTFGMSPGVLVVTPEKRVSCLGGGAPAANILDFVPLKNIMPFGMCVTPTNPAVASATAAAQGVLTPMPCVPVVTSPWTPGHTGVLIGPALALDQVCTCVCAWGGVISITQAGQATVDLEYGGGGAGGAGAGSGASGGAVRSSAPTAAEQNRAAAAARNVGGWSDHDRAAVKADARTPPLDAAASSRRTPEADGEQHSEPPDNVAGKPSDQAAVTEDKLVEIAWSQSEWVFATEIDPIPTLSLSFTVSPPEGAESVWLDVCAREGQPAVAEQIVSSGRPLSSKRVTLSLSGSEGALELLHNPGDTWYSVADSPYSAKLTLSAAAGYSAKNEIAAAHLHIRTTWLSIEPVEGAI